MMPEYVYMSVISASPDNIYWAGGYSVCTVKGSIHSYLEEILPPNVSVVIPKSDGFIGQSEYMRMCQNVGIPIDHCQMPESNYIRLERQKKPGTIPIVGCLCSRQFERSNLLHLPLDDDTFNRGLEAVLSDIPSPAWEDRLPVVFWRGGSSGMDRPSIRVQVASALYDVPNTDVRITPWGNWENEQYIDSKLFGNRSELSTHFCYKYILIIDGNCIASNHQWVFGSGSVPIMITHPDNKYWFQSLLTPMKNYVPIKYDLSDLREKIDWLLTHDTEAKEIAESAKEFARHVFSPEFQRKYIRDSVATIVYGTPSVLFHKYMEKSETPSDINEHLTTLHEYAKQCTSIVECGVREIVSSYAFASALIGTPNNSLTMIDLYESDKMKPFIALCQQEGVNASFIEGSDTTCTPVETDMLFIDTWHVYAHLKRELAHWHSVVRKYIALHDTTVDEIYGESIRGGANTAQQSRETGYPEHEIRRGLWPAVTEFLSAHPEWKIEKRYTHNNGLTILART